jgi:NAD(P)H-hydrate epimerase
LGPGWGKGEDRKKILSAALEKEKEGIPLVLDADAISLAAGLVFNGNVILTPHPGEFAGYSGIDRDELLSDPVPHITRFARERNGVILFKSHVMYIASPDGRLAVVDGMLPALAAGGTGDLLAGFCSAIAARMRRLGSYDGYTCAAAAAALLVETGKTPGIAGVFIDPLELADFAARLAGKAWTAGASLQPLN